MDSLCLKSALRKIFGHKRNEVSEEWSRLHIEEVHDIYLRPNIIRMVKSGWMIWAGLVARTEERKGAYRISVRRPEGKRPLERPKCRWEDNI
jgi:hypothetical protein